jgi:hypothetical protein
LIFFSDAPFCDSFILVGLLISYLPQHYRIISRGTAEGISPYFVLLGTTSATSGFANILTVPQSRAAIGCCKELEAFQCTAGLLGVAQLGTQWVCFTLMYVLVALAVLRVVPYSSGFHTDQDLLVSFCFSYSFDIGMRLFHLKSWLENLPNGRPQLESVLAASCMASWWSL